MSDSKPAGASAWRIIEPYWEAVSVYDGPLQFLQDFAQLPEPARHLFAVWWCDAEVCNGGFHQFFANSTGVLAPEAAQGFRAIGLDQCAECVESAIARFGDPYPRDQALRDDGLRKLQRSGVTREEWDPFVDLDDPYYKAREHSRFEERMDQFAERPSLPSSS